MGPAGLASTSPPQGTAGAASFNPYLTGGATGFGPQSGATAQHMFSQQFLHAAAAQNHLVHHDPRAPNAQALTGLKMAAGSQGNISGSMSKQQHQSVSNTQHPSGAGFGAGQTAANFVWQS